jgi:hypothetical protein
MIVIDIVDIFRAPDGTCILTNSNDNKLKLFNLPDELYYSGGENKIIDELVIA